MRREVQNDELLVEVGGHSLADYLTALVVAVVLSPALAVPLGWAFRAFLWAAGL